MAAALMAAVLHACAGGSCFVLTMVAEFSGRIDQHAYVHNDIYGRSTCVYLYLLVVAVRLHVLLQTRDV